MNYLVYSRNSLYLSVDYHTTNPPTVSIDFPAMTPRGLRCEILWLSDSIRQQVSLPDLAGRLLTQFYKIHNEIFNRNLKDLLTSIDSINDVFNYSKLAKTHIHLMALVDKVPIKAIYISFKWISRFKDKKQEFKLTR